MIHIIITRRSDNHVKLLQMVWLQVIMKEIMQSLNCRIIAFTAILHMLYLTCLYIFVFVFVSFCTLLYVSKFLHSAISVSNTNIKRHNTYANSFQDMNQSMETKTKQQGVSQIQGLGPRHRGYASVSSLKWDAYCWLIYILLKYEQHSSYLYVI